MVVCGIRSDEVRAKLLRDVIKGNICMSIYWDKSDTKGLAEEKQIDFVQKRGTFKLQQNPAKNGEAQQPHEQQPRMGPSQSYKCQK